MPKCQTDACQTTTLKEQLLSVQHIDLQGMMIQGNEDLLKSLIIRPHKCAGEAQRIAERIVKGQPHLIHLSPRDMFYLMRLANLLSQSIGLSFKYKKQFHQESSGQSLCLYEVSGNDLILLKLKATFVKFGHAKTLL